MKPDLQISYDMEYALIELDIDFEPLFQGKRTLYHDGKPIVRVCGDCVTVKVIDEFPANSNRKSGHDYICRECKKWRDKERYEKSV